MKNNRKKKIKKGLKNFRIALPFILPGLILVSVFVIYPMLFTLRISFSDYNIVKRDISFCGLKNYINIFTDPSNRFFYAFRNNFLYAIVTVPCIVFGGMVLAYLTNNLKKGQAIFRVGFYLPVITSWVIVSLVFTYMFNSSDRGLVNYLLVDKLHLLKHNVPWLLRTWTGNLAIWLMGIWKNIGWSMLIFLAALQSISPDLYEAASLDGAGTWKKFRYITIACVKPTIFYVMVNMIIGSFNVFIQVMLLTGGGPSGTTSVLQYLLYERAFSKFEFGEASAIGLVSAVTIMILTVVLNKIFKLDNNVEGDGI